MRSLVILAILLSIPTLVHAQSSAELIEQGVALREEGRDEEALARFEAAYQDLGSGEALAQIALAEQALGRLVESEAHLMSALAETADRFVRRNRAALENALEEVRSGLGDLELHGGPPGAEVWIGDISRGILPFAAPIRVPLGSVRVEIRERGHRTEESSVEVRAGVVARLELTTEPTATPPPPESLVVQPPPEPPVETAPIAAGTSDSVLLPVGIGIASLGVVLLGVATGMMVLREDNARARLTCSDVDPACRGHFQTAVDAEAAGIGLFAAGGLLVGVGAALAIFDLTSRPASEASAFACVPGALSVHCAMRF